MVQASGNEGRAVLIWLHINTQKQYLAVVNGINVETEYSIGGVKNTQFSGVFSIRRKIRNPKKYYTGEPKNMPANKLTGRCLELNFQQYDPQYGIYRPIAIHGCVCQKIENEPSCGCILMTNEDIIELYSLVRLSTPVVITDKDVFRDIVPTKLLEWCLDKGIDRIEWEVEA